MKEIVKIDNVTKEYGAEVKVQALRGVSFTVEAGAFAALVGPSGSGKSTLLNLIGGLDRPSTGRVLVDGVDTAGLSAAEMSRLRRDRIGLIFQAYNLLPVLTVYENAEYVLMLQGKTPAARRPIVMELLEKVGLKGMEHRFPRELSGGQQQRVAIARAIAAKPALVLADEPTANVDSKTADALLDLMARLNTEDGVTFLFSTHDPKVVKRARQVVTLRDGLIHREGAGGEEAA